jgi:hypothetical protein
MRNTWDRAGWLMAAILALFVVAAMAGVVRGGPLDPPGGPGSTDGVRLPGTPISAAGFDITQPGSYYLTRNITGVGGDSGVSIAASNVTLDLNGFTLSGAPGATQGIVVTGTRSAVTVRNGIVRDWPSTGVDLDGASAALLEDVRVLNNGGTQVRLGRNSTARNCQAGGGTLGIVTDVNSTITGCKVVGSATGIFAAGDTHVIDNTVDDAQELAPSDCGIVVQGSGNRVQGNAVTGSTRAFCTDAGAAGNVFAQNFAAGNDDDYGGVNALSNQLAPVVAANTAGASAWANVAY